jgi:hypothetical protein
MPRGLGADICLVPCMAQEKPIGSNDSQNNKSDWKNSPVLNALCIPNDATNR